MANVKHAEQAHHIVKAPRAFQAIAAKHNQLAKAHAGIEAGYGIVVQKSQGNTRISVIPSTVADIVGQVISGGGTTTELHYNDGVIQIDIDGFGINIAILSGAGFGYTWSIAQDGVQRISGGGSATLVIDPNEINYNMSIKEWAVCNSGTPANASFISSDPH